MLRFLMRILVVDDNEELLDLVGRSLLRDGNEVMGAQTAAQARRLLRANQVELVVLDLGLPDGSGLTLCRELRRAWPALPILVLTAQTAVATRVQSLDAGADDYLGKPFAVAELRARVRALARRTLLRIEPLVLGDCVLDLAGRRASVQGRPAPLTAREWAILELLAAKKGRVVGYDELLQAGWQRADDGARASLDVLIGRIRKKLGADMVRTIRGEGYVLGSA